MTNKTGLGATLQNTNSAPKWLSGPLLKGVCEDRPPKNTTGERQSGSLSEPFSPFESKLV